MRAEEVVWDCAIGHLPDRAPADYVTVNADPKDPRNQQFNIPNSKSEKLS
ncbi:hypothetical protein [Bradyrhizobium sp. 45]|nr:hypothetical protein [Bradyrhizobium sp. 45]